MKYLSGRRHCLELGAGGALLLFKNVLIDIFAKVDINELSREQMLASYATEDEINKNKEPFMNGVIVNRFQ